jgi:tetratricopeptide (TPR) repeat protein
MLCLADPHGTTPLDIEIRVTQRQVRSLSQNPDAWALAGRAWVRKARLTADPGFYVNAAGCIDAALRIAPGNLAALALRGLALMNDHKFAEARQVAEDILTKEPENTIALSTLSDALLELGQLDMAAATAQQLMDLRPDMASYARASYFRWLQGDTQNAKRFIQYALNAGKDPRDPEPTAWTFVQAAMLFWHEGDYDGADAVFAEALKWVPDHPAALVGRARVALSQEQPERAIEYLEKAYRLNPLPETAWLLGDARAMLSDSSGAQTEYERVIRQGEKSDRLTLASFYTVKGRAPEEALRLIETERGIRGGIYVNDTYAWALYRAGRISEARRASDQALRWGARDARLLYHAGAIRLAAGDQNGRQLIEQALALNPQFDWTGATEARELLNSHHQNSRES